jgi:hypothetical protein
VSCRPAGGVAGTKNGRIRELPTVVWAVRQMDPREVNMCRVGQGMRHAERGAVQQVALIQNWSNSEPSQVAVECEARAGSELDNARV